MSYVSDEAVQTVLDGLVINRIKRRAIQSMSREDLQRYVVHLYRQGFEDGAEAVQNKLSEKADVEPEDDTEEISVAWDDVLAVIGEVKGIGPKMLAAIDSKLREAY